VPDPPTKPNLAAVNVEIETLHDEFVAKAYDEVAHLDGDLRCRATVMLRPYPGSGLSQGLPVVQYLIPAKNMANSPSTTTTMKIDLTTEAVTCRPSDSAEPPTAKTFHAGNKPNDQRHERRLDKAAEKV